MDKYTEISVKCDPYGTMPLRCDHINNTETQVSEILREAKSRWPDLWPAVYSKVRDLLVTWKRPNLFATVPFIVWFRKEHGWTDEEFFIEVEFLNEDPYYCVWFEGDKVTHSQISL